MAGHQHRRAARPGLSRTGVRLRAGALGAVAVLVTALSFGGSVQAAPSWQQSPEEQLKSDLVRPPGITLEQAANKVRRETGGRVLSASPSERSGERGYEIRVLVDGKRVKSYFVDNRGRVRARD